MKFQPTSLAYFDIETKDMDYDAANNVSQSKDIGLDRKHDDLVDIFATLKMIATIETLMIW